MKNEKPKSTGVMEFYARQKNIDIKAMILKIAGLKELAPHSTISEVNNGYRITSFKPVLKQVQDAWTGEITCSNFTFRIEVNDFGFMVFCKDDDRFASPEEIYADLSRIWTNNLLKFDKEFMLKEFAEIQEYKKNQAIQKFLNQHSSFYSNDQELGMKN
ncbi:MAG: hypothetical protein IKT27_00710 [Clostridia bacterium]|nr:hypothetical protein [Clostridia bacterium]